MLGERLKEVRLNNNLTQNDIANKFNVTTATVSAWETEKAKPDCNILKGFAEEFNISADYLLGINNKEYERFRYLLKEAEKMLGDDLTEEEFAKALKVIEIMRDK